MNGVGAAAWRDLLDRHPPRRVETAVGAFSIREAGNGPVVVLLHGIGSGSGSWVHQIDRLSRNFRVIAWDAPGYGDSDPVPDGDVGEVVVTTLNADYPLIRFATGDLSAILPGLSPCGRTAPRIKGWMGRADQSTKVRGMFVHPEVIRGRLSVSSRDHQDVMTLACEVDGGGEALAHAIAESLRTICKLRGEVSLVAPGSLPNDGKVIEDQRSYE